MNDSVITLAYSPCPNDTFMFNAIANGSLTLPGFEMQVHLHDIETLNERAAQAQYDFTKLSIHACLNLREHYHTLNAGAALGFGCGPVVVVRQDRAFKDLSACSVAIPGELTTAHLLFRLWSPAADNRIFMPFDQIMRAVASGEVDVGVVIHEGRFTFGEHGLKSLVDLGEWWQAETDLPLPLGCIAARKSLGATTIKAFDDLLKSSIELATADPEATYAYVRKHAQELEMDVLEKHITTFVNDFSIDMGDQGRKAIQTLEERALKAGIL